MIVNLEQDGDDLILPFPEEMLDELGWKGGDVLEWVENEDKSLTLRKVK